MKELLQLVHDPKMYIEGTGKNDRHNVAQAIQEQGADSVVRICIWRI